MSVIDTTNLQKCKEVAIMYLHLVPITETEISLIVSHPFFNSPVVFDTEKKELINILEGEENIDKAFSLVEKQIQSAENYYMLLWLINKPYRLLYFELTQDLLSKEDYNKGLIDCFTADECANKNVNVSKRSLISMFKKTEPSLLMEEDDYNKYLELPEEIVVYRGLTNYNKDNIKALSWTLSLDKARWFANRFKEYDGTVYVATINKKDVFAYCDTRNEQEVILNPNKLEDIRIYEVLQEE